MFCFRNVLIYFTLMKICERYRLIYCNHNRKTFGNISSLVKVKRNVLLNTCVNRYSILILDIPLRHTDIT